MYDELVKDLREKAEFLIAAEPLNIKNAFAETMKQAADAIEKLSKPRWIPVTERLPGNGSVLIYSKAGGVAEGKYNPDTGEWMQYRWSAKMEQDITHWQLLPEPPKEEKK